MKKNIRINLILIILFFFTVVFSSSSQVDRYWTNAAGNNSWIDPDNWTDLDGMPGNPVSGDNVIFDATSPDDCNIDISSSLSLLNFVITSDYGGTINRITTAPLTINGTFEMEGGAFNAGSGSTVFAGTFNHTNGHFTASSGNMSFRNSFTSSGGGFIHNNGSVIFSTASLTINNTPVFNNVFFTNPAGSNSLTFTIANSITINGDLTYNTGSTSTSARIITVNTGTINLKGNLILGISTNPAPTNGGGTATIILNGTGTQTITGRADGAIPLPNLEINSSTNRVIEVIDVATTNGNFSITGSGNVAINTGTIGVKGDVTLSNTGSDGGGTGTVLLNNTSAAQIVSGTSTFGNSALPNLTIDKGTAGLTFSGTVSLTGVLNYSSGIIDMGSSSIAYSGGNGQVVFSPTGNFPAYNVLTIAGTGAKTVTSDLITNNLILANADLNVEPYKIRVLDDGPSAIIRFSGDEKVIGTIERSVSVGTPYSFPVGVASSDDTQQFDFTLTSTSSSSTDDNYVSISFSDAATTTSSVTPSAEGGVTFDKMIEGGYWIINGSVLDPVYNVVLHPVGFTFGTNEAYTVFKREGSGNWHASGDAVVTPSTSTSSMTRTGMIGFSNIGVGGGENTPTPVDLSHFNANLEKDHVLLDWATLSETKSSHFIIERSKTANEFKAIGRVESAGNSSERIEYAFEDEEALELFSTTLFYRLRQVDVDGQFKIYPMKAVDMSKIIDSKLNIYPNPAHADITVSSRFEKPLYLEVVNSNGKLIHSTSVKKGKTTLKKLSLQKGIYVFKFISGETVVNKRVAFE